MDTTRGQMLGASRREILIGGLWLPWYMARLPQSARKSFTAAPSVLLVSGALGIGLSLLKLSRWEGDTSRLIMLAGAVATIRVAYRLAVPPGAPSCRPSPIN